MPQEFEGYEASGALTGTEIVPIVQSGALVQTTTQDIADLGGGGGGGPLEFVAQIMQTGTDLPVLTIISNTLSGTPTIVDEQSTNGYYLIQLTGAFPEDKTFIGGYSAIDNSTRLLAQPIFNAPSGSVYGYFTIRRIDDDNIALQFNVGTIPVPMSTALGSGFGKLNIPKIEVYP